MNKFLDADHGLTTLLASIVVLMSLHLFAGIGKFLWDLLKKKNETSEETMKNLTVAININTTAVQKLETRLTEVEQMISEIPKFKQDLRRLYIAVKHISGESWTSVRKIIMDDEAGL